MYLKLMDIDELFDFFGDRDDVFFSSATTDIFHNVTSSTNSGSEFQYSLNNSTTATDFTDHFCLPNDDVAELEWLSKFVDDSVSNFPEKNIAGTMNFRPENTSFHNRSRSKRTRAPSNNNNSWMTSATQICETTSSGENSGVRRCTHCLSEKTPQWRTGPLGPKTLCNACGVRFKSGRLVPEYRPAASPTFVLTQHSNSHRKVMELRRQKEVTSVHPQYRQQQQVASSQHQIYGGGNHYHHHYRQQQQLHHGSNYEIC